MPFPNGPVANALRGAKALGASLSAGLALVLLDESTVPLLGQQGPWLAHHLRRATRNAITKGLETRCAEGKENTKQYRKDLAEIHGEVDHLSLIHI